MKLLEEKLGKALRTKDIAKYLGVDEKTVREYYQLLGGIRLGRRYIFFEKEVINAIQKRAQMGWSGAKAREEEREGVPDKERGTAMGSRDEAEIRRRLAQIDRHNLFS